MKSVCVLVRYGDEQNVLVEPDEVVVVKKGLANQQCSEVVCDSQGCRGGA